MKASKPRSRFKYKKMIISIIAAIGKNNELGKNNALLWRLPADMKHFKDITSGHPIIMGWKTFLSIGKPLPNRRNIVITNERNYKNEEIEVVHSLEEAFQITRQGLAQDLVSKTSPLPAQAGQPSSKTGEEEEVFVIGGAYTYKQALEYANKLYITHIEAEDKDADVFFPEIIPIVFGEVSREAHEPDEKNPVPYSFVKYERIF